jgi:glycosyltransferase involved in cell wall biosynthesis
MNEFEKTLAVGSRGLAEVSRIVRPRLLLFRAGGRDDDLRATDLAGLLSDDGWSVRVMGDLAVKPPESPGWFGRLRSLKNIVQVLPHRDVLHVIADHRKSFWRSVVPALILGRFFGKQVVLTFEPAGLEDYLDRWIWLVRPFLRLADRLLVENDHTALILGHHRLYADVLRSPLGVSMPQYREISPLQPHILVDRPLQASNNIGCIIRAFALVKQKYPRAELTIVGEGPDRPNLVARIVERQINSVQLLGEVSEDARRKLYGTADLVVNPSSLDTFPRSIFSAFAAGLPVVTTDAGSIPELVTHGENGLVIPVNDHVAMADGIIDLIENHDLVRSLTRRARESIEKLSWAAVGRPWRRFYRDLSA